MVVGAPAHPTPEVDLQQRQRPSSARWLAPGILTIVPSLAIIAEASPDRCLSLERRGTELPDLIWEFEQHAPLNLNPRYAFEYVIAKGVVTSRGPKETGDEDWLGKTCFPAWAQTTIDVQMAAAVNCSVDTTAGQWTFVERHGYFRDEKAGVFEPYWGQGTERYNRLRVGDRVIAAAVRKRECEDSCFYYSPEFCPHFSIVFNVVIREDVVCVDVPWQHANDGFWFGDKLRNEVLPTEAIARTEHCYSVSAGEAFDAIVKAAKAGTPHQDR